MTKGKCFKKVTQLKYQSKNFHLKSKGAMI